MRVPGSCAARAADSPCGRAMKISSASPKRFRRGRGEVLAVERGVTGEVRVDRGDRLARAAARGHRRDLQVGVPGEQAEEFPARVAAGARDSDPYAHAGASFSLREYASHCMNMQDGSLAGGWHLGSSRTKRYPTVIRAGVPALRGDAIRDGQAKQQALPVVLVAAAKAARSAHRERRTGSRCCASSASAVTFGPPGCRRADPRRYSLRLCRWRRSCCAGRPARTRRPRRGRRRDGPRSAPGWC